MSHVRWDEEGLEKAAQDVAGIPKRLNRPPPEPKTPFPPPAAHAPDATGLADLRLSESAASHSEDSRAGDDSAGELTATEGEDEGDSRHDEFAEHRRHHYSGDGDALAKGRGLVSDSDLV